MNEIQFRKALLAAFGGTGNVNNEREFRKNLAAAVATSLYTDTKARNAIKTKTQINALTGASTASDIVTALKA